MIARNVYKTGRKPQNRVPRPELFFGRRINLAKDVKLWHYSKIGEQNMIDDRKAGKNFVS
jgi:hypothetical protein